MNELKELIGTLDEVTEYLIRTRDTIDSCRALDLCADLLKVKDHLRGELEETETADRLGYREKVENFATALKQQFARNYLNSRRKDA